MTLSEFKAWFDGYVENMDETPNKKQWKRIQARVAEIDGQVVTERVYLDRYLPTYPRYFTSPPVSPFEIMCGTSDTTDAAGQTVFNATSAMMALGTADAQADAA